MTPCLHGMDKILIWQLTDMGHQTRSVNYQVKITILGVMAMEIRHANGGLKQIVMIQLSILVGVDKQMCAMYM